MALLSRRPKSTPAPDPVVAKPGGKGRATPSRKTAQASRPVGPYLRTAATTGSRKERGSAGRTARRAEMERQRAALRSGDVRNLPARDRGPERALTRDLVDARKGGVLQLFPFVAIISVLASFARSAELQFLASTLLMAVLIAGLGDAFLLTRRIGARLATEHPDSRARVRLYAVQRAVLPRRFRLPPPRVERGASV